MDTTVEFKVQVGLELANQYGKERIEKLIQDCLYLAVIKLAKQELPDDLSTVNINDKAWLDAREKARTEYGSKYLFQVTACI